MLAWSQDRCMAANLAPQTESHPHFFYGPISHKLLGCLVEG